MQSVTISQLRQPILLLAVSAGLSGCIALGQTIRGSGELASENRTVGEFSEVVVTNQGDLEIQLGSEESLVIEADDNLLAHLSSEVRGGKLYLGTTPRGANLRPRRWIRYFLTVRALEGVQTSSSGDIRADRLEAERFSVRTSSSGDITIGELNARRLDANISSSGDISISRGEVDILELSVTSSGDFDGGGMRCREADVHISSSGDAHVRVDSKLTAKLSSSGDLYYEGDPEVDSRVTSSGRVRQRN